MADPVTVMSSDQAFILEVLKLVVPVISAVVAYLTLRKTQSVDRKANLLTEKQEQIHRDVNGKMQQLIDATGRAAHAEGKAEGLEQSPPAPPVVVLAPSVTRNPHERTRASDHHVVPPSIDPSTHQ